MTPSFVAIAQPTTRQFIYVPESLLMSDKISEDAKAVYIFLACYAISNDKRVIANLSKIKIIEKFNGLKKFLDSLKELVEFEYVGIDPTEPDIYVLIGSME